MILISKRAGQAASKRWAARLSRRIVGGNLPSTELGALNIQVEEQLYSSSNLLAVGQPLHMSISHREPGFQYVMTAVGFAPQSSLFKGCRQYSGTTKEDDIDVSIKW